MPHYNYICNTCLAKAEKVKGSALTSEEEYEVIFETYHSMDPTPEDLAEATQCPRCEGNNVERTMKGYNVLCYVRGNGYLDKAGCHRDMNVHKLETDDPYGHMREPGEVDYLKAKFVKAGQYDPGTKHFGPTK